jgi:hypothetical protein
MAPGETPVTILIADDDAEDRVLIEEAFGEANLANRSICGARASSAISRAPLSRA